MHGAGKNMDSDEFSTSPVPANRSIPWWKIALTNVLFSICLPTLITGLIWPSRRRSAAVRQSLGEPAYPALGVRGLAASREAATMIPSGAPT